MNKKYSATRITLTGIFTALAFILGWLESLIPPFTGIPGVKAGFANIVTMIALFLPVQLPEKLRSKPALKTSGPAPVSGTSSTAQVSESLPRTDISSSEKILSVGTAAYNIKPAFSTLVGASLISLVRILLGGITYNGMSAVLYGLAGAALSITVMYFLAGTGKFSVTAVSVAGAVSHNTGQTLLAVCMLGRAVIYYLPMLIISGLISGIITGVITGFLIRRLFVLDR